MRTLDEALELTAETADVDFKSHFEPTSAGEMLEVVKDIVAIANNGGGHIIFGLDDSGTPIALEERALKAVDPADFGDKIFKYCDTHFGLFEIQECQKNGSRLSALSIGQSDYPIVFSKTGNYQVEGGKQKNAFLAGMVYFRHGAKSEPGSYDDLRSFFDRKVEGFRKQWLEGIARVIEAPAGSRIEVFPPEIRHSPDAPTAIRLTSDPSAPAYYAVSIDDTHPYRQKDLLAEIQREIGVTPKLTSFHIGSARKEFALDSDKRYVFKLAHASPQYSKECAAFLLQKHNEDPKFFSKIADKHRKYKKQE